MSYLDRIRACNNANLTRQTPFLVAGERLGWLAADAVDHLTTRRRDFLQTDRGMELSDGLATVEARTALFAEVASDLADDGLARPPTGELYAARNRWADTPRFLIDRAATTYFGLRNYGVHIHGYVRKRDGLHLWIGTRSAAKPTYPGELDNTVAGGQPYDLTLDENVIKECAEEAGIPEHIAKTALPVGCITYFREENGRIKPDCMYSYDLELPDDFVPVNTDGELERFDLMPAAEVMRLVRETTEFKFNCSAALIDFFVRHGLLQPDSEPDYAAIVNGLRRHGDDGTAP